MSKDNYNIDDILSEINEHKKANNLAENAKKTTNIDDDTDKILDELAQKNEHSIPTPVVEKPTPVVEKPTPVVEKPTPVVEKPTPVVEEPAPVVEEKSKKDDTSMVNLFDLSNKPTEEQSDLLNNSTDENSNLAKGKPKKKKSKSKKIVISVICIILALVVGACGFVYFYANNALNKITKNNTTVAGATTTDWSGMDELVETFEPIEETDASSLSSLQDMIKTWYYNGVPCSSSHVLNVLLIGEDTRGTEILEDGTRADSAIIASINKDTKKITLTSILRDTYTYFEANKNDSGTGQFDKINAAMSIGNVQSYINCVESMYKIDIDNYVIVNFDSFEKIIDELGGVTLELTSAEINEINNHPSRYNQVYIEQSFSGNSGKIKLTGKQALAYCRIRKLDSDNARADRQKTCLNTVFDEMRDASNVTVVKILNSVLPYVETGFEKKQLVQIAKYAVNDGWLDFKVVTQSIPNSRIEENGAGGVFYGTWIWKSDFPQDAYNLQMSIYGKSSITLARTRVDVLNCAEKGFYSEGYGPVDATIINYNYGEVSTTVSTTTEDESTTKVS